MNPQVKRLVTEVHDDWLARIERATDGTVIKSAVVAAMIPNEAGRYRTGPSAGRINAAASRLETGVFKKLRALRDVGFYMAGGRRLASYNGVRQTHLLGASDEALENLSSSWGVMQIMGYYILWLFRDTDGTPVTIEELRHPDRHFHYAAQLLLADAPSREDLRRLGAAIESGDRRGIDRYFERTLRRWNSGSPTGRTYDPDYVEHGLAYLHAWLELYGDEDPEQSVDLEARAVATGVVAGEDIEVRPEGAEAPPTELAAAPEEPQALAAAPAETGGPTTPTPTSATEVAPAATPAQPSIWARLTTSTTFLQSSGIQVASIGGAIGAFFAWPGAPWIMLALVVIAGLVGWTYQRGETKRKEAEAAAQAKIREAEAIAAARIEEARKHEPSPDQVAALRAKWEAEQVLAGR